MKIRTFKKQDTNTDLPSASDLPLERKIGIYYRQSTMAQVGNISTAMQTIDLVADVQRRGWSDDKIVLIDMDRGMSGTLAIDDRPGMKELYSLITNGEIGAVAVQDVDRLFRDITQIQTNVFIDACKRNRVQVLTPSVVYNFHHPLMGDMFQKAFRTAAEAAADYLKFMHSRLHAAKNRKRKEGFYVGSRVPLGYMVDIRESSPTYHKLVPWEEVAEIVREVFKTFVECDGRAYPTVRSLRDRGIGFGIVHTQKPPEGFVYPTFAGLKGTLPTQEALVKMVTHPAYIGHWMYKGEVAIWNHHEPIVPTDLFFAAFNLVSPYNLDGTPNPHYKERKTRVHIEEDRPMEIRPLLEGLVYTEFEGEQKQVSTWWDPTIKAYCYGFHVWRDGSKKWMRRAGRIDEVVEYHFLERLSLSFREDLMTERIKAQADQQAKALRAKKTQLAALRTDEASTLTNMTRAKSENAFSAMEKRYNEILTAIQTAEALIAQMEGEKQNTLATMPALQVFQKALRHFDKATAVEKRRMFRFMIDRVIIVPSADVRYFNVVIRWSDGEISDHHVWNRHVDAYTYADQVFLMEHFAPGSTSSRETVMERFPGRDFQDVKKTVKHYMPNCTIPLPANPNKHWKKRFDKLKAQMDNSCDSTTISESDRSPGFPGNR